MAEETVEVETRARELGWSPKEEFRGDPDKWIDADTFVKRGEELMPLLKATTKRQSAQLKDLQDRVVKAEKAFAESQESIHALIETTSKEAMDKLRRQQDELKGTIKQAREEGDLDAEEEARGRLTEVRQALKDAEVPPVKPVQPPTNQEHPDFKAWANDNEWWGKDLRKTSLALGIAQELRASGEKSEGRAFFDKVSEEVDKTFGGTTSRERPSKVEGGGRPSAGGGSKTYADLPQDAKEACERQSRVLVGPNRSFKTADAWRKHYAEQFFAE